MADYFLFSHNLAQKNKMIFVCVISEAGIVGVEMPHSDGKIRKLL